MKRSILLALCASLALAVCAPAATIFVVRHAERGAGGMSPDVPLSEAGQTRAKELARVLKDAGVKTIITTELQRTRQTAAQLAARLQITPTVVAAKDFEGLISKLKSLGDADVAVVVGHSNTVPLIIERLTGAAVKPIDDAEYDRLYVVNTTGKPAVVALRYGAE
jgi:2,3-bisphosphoglycerate-dependent phosphoglycerate mutase